MDDEQDLLAYHEAGHAFTAVWLGGIVRYVSIAPDRHDGPQREGEAQIAWRKSRMTAKEFQHKQVLVALGGPAAEMIFRGEPLHPGYVAEWAEDWRDAWACAAPIFPDERKRLVFLEDAARELYQSLRSDDLWQAIAALADALLAHEILDHEQVQEAIEPWLPER